MARATYYYSIKNRKDKYALLRKSIARIFAEHNGCYGYRRVYEQLRAEGYTINHKTIAKLMVEMDLYARRRKVRYRSYKGDVGRIAPNLLQRNFMTDGPNQKWATDITQIDIQGRKCYLSPILDMWNGEIISYTISDSPNMKMVTDMPSSVENVEETIATGARKVIENGQVFVIKNGVKYNVLGAEVK